MKKSDRFKLFCRFQTTVVTIKELAYGLLQLPKRMILPLRFALRRIPFLTRSSRRKIARSAVPRLDKSDRFKLFCKLQATLMTIREILFAILQFPKKLVMPLRFAVSRLPYIPLKMKKALLAPVRAIRSLYLPLRFLFYKIRFFPRFVRFLIHRVVTFPTRLRAAYEFRASRARHDTVETIFGLPEDIRKRKRQMLIQWARKTTKIAVVAMVFFGAMGAAGKWVALPAYRDWKQEKLLRDARAFFEEGDHRGAILSVHQVLRTNYGNLDAHRLMVEIGVALETPESLEFQERVAQMEPSWENLIAWARLALDLEHSSHSRRALTALAALDSGSTDYLMLLARDHRLRNQHREAAAVYENLLTRDPDHGEARYQLAALRAMFPQVFPGRDRFRHLERLVNDPGHGTDALRLLIRIKYLEGDWVDAIHFAGLLEKRPDAGFNDRILIGSTFASNGFPSGRELLRSLIETAGHETGKIFLLAEAMLAQGDHKRVEDWLTNLPPEVKINWEIKHRLAESMVAGGAWNRLESTLRNESWGGVDFARHLFLRRAFLELNRPGAAEEEWRLALAKADGEAFALQGIYNQARFWGWEKESLDVLRRILERHPRERWAAAELHQRALQTGRTAELRAVFSFLHKIDPGNLKARNDLARTNLLLGQELPRAHAMAEEMHALDPLDPDFAATVALSRYLRGKVAEGIAALEGIAPTLLRDHPAAGLYYGLLLSEAGRGDEARELWALAWRVALTPEERQLLGRAGIIPPASS